MALYIYDILIVGTDTYYGENPILTDITDGTNASFTCNKINLMPTDSQEEEEYDGGLILDSTKYRFGGTLEYAPYVNPNRVAPDPLHDPPIAGSAIKLIDFFTFMAPFKKTFKYIFSTNYPVELQALWEDSNKGVRVIFAPLENEITQNGLLKYFKLPFKKASLL